MKRVLLLVAAGVVCSLAASASFADTAAPLAPFEPYIGKWGPDPASPQLEKNPERADDVAFAFIWSGPDRKVLRFYEGIPDGDMDRRVLETLVVRNPVSGRFEFIGYQTQADFFYRGQFELRDDGFLRSYDVSYPETVDLSATEYADTRTIRYRDTCTHEDLDTLQCVTERFKAGEWQPWGGGTGWRIVRLKGGEEHE